MGYQDPQLLAFDTTTQSIAIANTPQVVTFNSIIAADKIIVTSPSRFTINESGAYRFIIRPHLNLTGGSPKTFNIFIRKNGVDVPNSNGRWIFNNTASDGSQDTIFALPLVTADYVEIWISSDTTNFQMLTVAATAIAPQTPSIVIALRKVA